MAITKLNSLAIPDDTIVEADLSYPLTGFSSTGIDDNADATCITISSAEKVGINNASPSELLSMIGTGGTAKIRFDGDSSNLQNNFIGITGYDDLIIASDEANSGTASTIQFRVDATTRFVMNSAGHTTLIGSGSTNNNNTAEVLSVTGSNHVRHMISTSATNGSQASLALESNSATVAIATTGSDEMRFTTNSAEQLRINSAGNVLIGTDNGWFSASGRRILRVQGGANGSFLVLDTSGSGDFYIESSNSGLVAHWNQANGSMIFGTNNTERMRILASGGLTFNGDTATANALDDYEEGVHTTSVSAGSGTPSISSTENKASYTVVGDSVFISGQLGSINCSGCSGALYVTMPFVTKTNTDRSDFYFLFCASTVSTIDYFYLSQTGGGSSTFLVVAKKSDGSADSNVATLLASHGVFDLNITGGTYKKS